MERSPVLNLELFHGCVLFVCCSPTTTGNQFRVRQNLLVRDNGDFFPGPKWTIGQRTSTVVCK
jgi:hypothetical protein